MIVPMKKLTLICLAADRQSTLSQLRELGVLHLAPVSAPESPDLDRAAAELRRAESALAVLQGQLRAGANAASAELDGAALVEQVGDLVRRKKELSEQQAVLLEEKRILEPWGDFDYAQLERLAAAGVIVRLYHTTSRKDIVAPEGTLLRIIREDRTGWYFAILGRTAFEFELPEVTLPERRLTETESALEAVNSGLAAADADLAALSANVAALDRHMAALRTEHEYLLARDGMGATEKLAYLQGFCPTDHVDRVRKSAAAHGWGLVIEDPSDTDRVPTLVRYAPWVRIIRPVFEFLGIVPGYREYDVSPAFLVFLTLFFATIVGDAGYGILFVILTPYLRKKHFSDAPSEPFRLLYLFSGATIVWGVLTGNYFGISYDALPSALQQLRIGWLLEQNNAMTFSLVIGGIHLTLAHTWKAIVYGKDLRTIVELGWITIIWLMFVLARYLLVNAAFPLWFLAIPILGILAMAGALAKRRAWLDLFLLGQGIIGNFGDLMSYLRLFALGIASVKVAESFNNMAGDLGVVVAGSFGDSIPVAVGYAAAALPMLLVLVVGHGVNIVLCGMSVLVHGIRLNALEFSLHMGQEWSGFEYKPFSQLEPALVESTT